MRIAIVDDMPADRENLRDSVCRWGNERHIHIIPPELFDSGESFMAAFSDDRFDIIFLDIYMDGINGMETARLIRKADKSCRIIFTTSSADFAPEGYEVMASAYLIKPYNDQKLWSALDRCGAALLERRQNIAVPDKIGEQRLYLHKIAYTVYENRRICVHNVDGTICYVPMRQTDFSALLLKYPYFCEPARGYLLNLESVSKVTKDSFILKNGQHIPVSRLKYKEMREQFINFTYTRAREGL